MWISKEELQKLVEKRARGLFVSDRIEAITQQTETLKKRINSLELEKNELDKQNVTLEIINCRLKSQLDELVDSGTKSSLNIVSKCQKLNNELKHTKEEYEKLYELWTATYKVNRIYEKKIQELFSENETLKSKELKDIENICDGVDSELLNLCIKLLYENLLLIHKQPIVREPESVSIVKLTYFTKNENHECFDLCEILNNGAKIGSYACKHCLSCVESNIEEQWVKCSKRPEGKLRPSDQKSDIFGVISEAIDAETACNLCAYFGIPSSKDPCDTCSFRLEDNEFYLSR